MLSAGTLREEVEVILDLIVGSRIEEAKQRIALLSPQVSSEYAKGVLLALEGILKMSKSKTGESALGRERVTKSAESVTSTQMVDDLDKGYFQTLLK